MSPTGVPATLALFLVVGGCSGGVPLDATPTPATPVSRVATRRAQPERSAEEDPFLRNEAHAFEALARWRVLLLEPSATQPGRGRFPAGWREAEGLLERLERVPKPPRSEVDEGAEIAWWSPSEDGHLYLVVTDEQIYLRSGHDNPRVSRLYWVAGSSAKQRDAVEKLLEHPSPALRLGDCKVHPSGYEACVFRAPTLEAPPHDEDDDAWMNVRALLTALNGALPPDVARLPVPAREELATRVPLAAWADELLHWLSVPLRSGVPF